MSDYREIAHSSKSPEWYTPVQYIDAARFVMNGIELDPASTAEANLCVKADRYYTKDDDGLKLDWTASSVYCNPPSSGSGRSAQAAWFAKAEKEYLEGRAKEIVFCMFNSSGTQTKWYQAMFGNYPICFPDHRIKFVAPADADEEEKDNSPVHASAFIYLGHHNALFAAAFRRFGKVMPAFLKE